MNRSRTVGYAVSALSVALLAFVACGGGDDNAGGDDTTTDSGTGADSTVVTDSGPPADGGPAEAGPFCNVSPCAVVIGAGASQTCAGMSDGTLRCWGSNLYGELGSGTQVDGGTVTPTLSATPLTVAGLTNAVSITGGGEYSADVSYTCASLANKSAYCWGFNQLGEAANGDAATPASPVPNNTLLTNALSVAGSLYATCAVLASGDITCWGANAEGQVAPESALGVVYPVPTVLSAGGTKFAQVSVGLANACGRTTDGHVWCWGLPAAGENGHYTDGGAADMIPAPVPGLDSVVDIAAGYEAACAVKSDGSLVCWGLNAVNILGRAGDAGPFDPNPGPIDAPGTMFKNVSAHVAGFCGLANDGTVWCWGYNIAGVAGTGYDDAGTTVPSVVTTPTKVAGLTDVDQIASGTFALHVCALVHGGAVKCWGINSFGQIGTAIPVDAGAYTVAPVTVTF